VRDDDEAIDGFGGALGYVLAPSSPTWTATAGT
jgi:hypothetical protein